MAYLIGTDEAGYGPNLGPLVVSASLWEVPDVHRELYSVLADAVSAPRTKHSEPEDAIARIEIGDSKALYQPKGSLARLEGNVLACLKAGGCAPSSWTELLQRLCETPHVLDDCPWFLNERKLPINAEATRIEKLAERLSTVMEKRGVRLVKVLSSVLFPDRFNDGVRQHGNKATLLSATTLQLIQRMLGDLKGEFRVVCDRHGGRSKYAGLAQQFLTDSPLQVVQETGACSRYTWHETHREVEIDFMTNGESFLPTGLASMVSKYLRELAMIGWNAYWRNHLPDLKPTAGYPVDAKRFKAAIESKRAELQIADELIWRVR